MIRPIVTCSALTLAVALALTVAPILPSHAAEPGDVVAVVGTKNITVKDLNDKYDDVVKQTINPPTKEVFLEDLIRYEMGVQEAYKRKLEDDPIVKNVCAKKSIRA